MKVKQSAKVQEDKKWEFPAGLSTAFFTDSIASFTKSSSSSSSSTSHFLSSCTLALCFTFITISLRSFLLFEEEELASGGSGFEEPPEDRVGTGTGREFF